MIQCFVYSFISIFRFSLYRKLYFWNIYYRNYISAINACLYLRSKITFAIVLLPYNFMVLKTTDIDIGRDRDLLQKYISLQFSYHTMICNTIRYCNIAIRYKTLIAFSNSRQISHHSQKLVP